MEVEERMGEGGGEGRGTERYSELYRFVILLR